MFTRWLTDDSRIHRTIVRRRLARAVLLVVCAALAAGLGGCALLPDEMVEEEIPTIQPPRLAEKPTYEVTRDTIITRVRGTGKIMSMKEQSLFFPMEGSYRVKNVYVQPGDHVEEGTLIAELDVQQLEDELRLEEVAFREKEINMMLTLRNTEGLSDTELELKKIQFEKDRLALVEKREKIARARLTAPFSGTVVSIHVRPGETVQGYEQVALIADTSQLTVAVKLSADDLKKVAIGMEAEVDINAAGSHKGKVFRFPMEENQQNNNPPWYGGGYQQQEDTIDNYLLIELDAFPENVTRATPLSAAIIVDRRENVVVIPPAALRTYGGRTYVQVVEEDGTKREVDVEVGRQTSTQVEIVKGLEPGMKVVGR